MILCLVKALPISTSSRASTTGTCIDSAMISSSIIFSSSKPIFLLCNFRVIKHVLFVMFDVHCPLLCSWFPCQVCYYRSYKDSFCIRACNVDCCVCSTGPFQVTKFRYIPKLLERPHMTGTRLWIL
ncbi:hypothetical protein SK128_021851 [Halocaridina rubra]|uniref:Uncharacterized protein n=1 Tax=Halocaridina rubra TaxID=373956 RepID=A0AAN8WLV0_HALRR